MTDIASGRRDLDGQLYWEGGDGTLVPEEAVKAADKLEDELVREIVAKALPIADIIAAFRQDTFDKADAFVALLEQSYGAKRGGTKGNLTFTSFDKKLKIEVSVAESIMFGPELQVAKGLVDDCLRDWAKDSGPEIRAIVTRAFDVDQQGQINRGALLGLLRLDIFDDRWKAAMDAIRDSMRVVGSKRYVRMYRRSSTDARWEAITLNIAV